ncbi:MAG: LolA-related protein [Burkholderiaceae bacterium]
MLAALCVLPVCGQAQSDAFGLAPLMQLLAQTRSGAARFTERRTVAMLERPLESSGQLWFEAPDTFVRETSKPRIERFAVVGNAVTITQGGRSRTLALDSVPEAGIIVEAIRATLTGNRAALERHFEVRVSGQAERWTLELVPLDARLRAQVATLRLSGRRAQVHELRVTLADGDHSVMTIEPLDATAAASAPR